MLRMTMREFQERFGQKPKARKYKNEPIEIDGHKFPSLHEANRYCELVLMQNAGKIFNLRVQVRYELIPTQYEDRFRKKGVIERSVTYIADFTYNNEDRELIVEDAKGYRTREYIIKRKLMLWVHKIRIKEV